MFWDIVLFLMVIGFGLLNILIPDVLVKWTWAVRRGINEEGQRELTNGIRFLGFLILAGALIWLRTEGFNG